MTRWFFDGVAWRAGCSGSRFAKRFGTAESAFKFWVQAVAGAAILDEEASETDDLVRGFEEQPYWRGRGLHHGQLVIHPADDAVELEQLHVAVLGLG